MPALDLSRLRVRPLAERRSLTRLEDILVPLSRDPAPLDASQARLVDLAAEAIRDARGRGAPVVLMYGAHLLRNGAALLLADLMEKGFLQHIATNGAGTIHDWEYSWFGRSTEGVEENVAAGTFGTWDETGRNIHLALMAGALQGLGWGGSLGRFIHEDGCDLPPREQLAGLVSQFPADPMAPACCELLAAMERHDLHEGRHDVQHPSKHGSILAAAWRNGVTVTVHPGIGYDIISCHPMFNGAVLGRAAAEDFRRFAGIVAELDHGVVLSVGSAIMAPQVFEKSLSCAHNIRYQAGGGPVAGHRIFVVDLQDGGGWDWTQGEPPKSNPAYYLRFCKSFSRMGGTMHYAQCDNLAFMHHLHRRLIATLP